jgi:hypothetical protein
MNTQNIQPGAENTTAAQQLNERGEVLALWVIVGNSAINPFRWCVIGEGATDQEAWRNAYGDAPAPRKNSRRARTWAEHISYEHYDRLMQAEASA